MKYFILFILLFLYYSCTNKEQKVNPVIDKTKVSDCITYRDTVFPSGDYIKYIEVDSLFGIELKLGKYIDTLKELFSCKTANISIQHLFKYNKNMLFLTEGSGQQYRRLYLYYIKENKIKYDCYESSLVYPKSPNVIVYKLFDKQYIYIYDYRNGKITFQSISKEYQEDTLESTLVFPTYFLLKFKMDKELKIKHQLHEPN